VRNHEVTDEPPKDDQSENDAENKEPILLNWLITLAVLGAIALAGVWLSV
jgi:hypothetical protein